MRKLALSDEILLSVQQPARYIGGEVNMRVKDPKKADIRFAMCFPDVYEIGMSHLGIQILYSMFNNREDIYCERVYSPWTDLDPILRENKIPLFTLETQEPVKNFDFLGITLQYEMCYTNVLQILDLSQIPLHTCDRTENDPIVIGGGPCAYNPEPLADFFDLFYIGEGETVYFELMDRYKENKKAGGTRKQFLERAAEIPGIYVPAFYDVTYKKDGTIECFRPNNEHAMPVVTKQIVSDMDSVGYIEKPLVPFIKVTQDRVVLEIQRGCIRGCRFCQAGDVYRPLREHSLEYLKHYAYGMLRSTGHEEISLSSLSSSDYSQLEGLVNFLIDEFKGKGVNISLPSLRIDAFSLDIMSKVQDVKKSSLTFAPEAGSQRLRDVINKGVSEEDLLAACTNAFKSGWNTVKLYFMMGLPTETDEDLAGIANLAYKVLDLHRDITGKRNGSVTVSVSFFVPKTHSPYQWYGQQDVEEIHRKQKYLKSLINNRNISYHYHDGYTGYMEAVFARGDRRLSKVLVEAWKLGCKFDGWTEFFSYETWLQAFENCGVDPAYYARRTRDFDEPLPWDHLDCTVSKAFLQREWEQAVAEKLTPDCRRGPCKGCNVCPELDTAIVDYKEGGRVEKITFGLT